MDHRTPARLRGEGRSPRSRRRATIALGLAATLTLLAGCSSGAEAGGPSADEVPSSTPSTVAPTTTSTRPPEVAERVLVLGDSSMVDAALAIEPAFTAAGAEVVVSDAAVGFGLSGVAAARLPSPWPEVWPALVEQVEPDLSIVMMGGWDETWIAENGVDAYRDMAARAAAVLTARGGRVLWLSMLPDKVQKPQPEPPNAAYVGLPDRLPGEVHFVDIAPALLGPDGDYPPSFVEDGELVRSRKVDGWHLCQDGAVRIAELVNQAAVDLGLAAPAPDGWQLGAWWDLEEFTQSPACWAPGAWDDGGPDRTPPAPWPAGTPAPQR
jgi:hypothetical protein